MGEITCPCCGAPLPSAAAVDSLKHAKLPKAVLRAVEVLARAYPGAVHRSLLLDTVYASDPQGGPVSDSLRTQISKSRRVLASHGWAIGSHGHLGFVSLRPTESQKVRLQ